MDRERPQARRRPTRSLLPPSPRCSHRADWLLPHTRHAVRDQCRERLDPPRRDRRGGTTGSRTANKPDRLEGQRSPEVIRTSAIRAGGRHASYRRERDRGRCSPPGRGRGPYGLMFKDPALWICAWAGRYRDDEAPSRGHVSNPCSNTADFADARECSSVSKSLVAPRFRKRVNVREVITPITRCYLSSNENTAVQSTAWNPSAARCST